MSIALMSLVFKLPATVGPDERAILLPLANEARDDGHCGKWSPEIADIAAASGMSERSVQRYLAAMSDPSPEACARRGLPPLLVITPRFGPDGKGGRQKGNYYRLRLPGMPPGGSAKRSGYASPVPARHSAAAPGFGQRPRTAMAVGGVAVAKDPMPSVRASSSLTTAAGAHET